MSNSKAASSVGKPAGGGSSRLANPAGPKLGQDKASHGSEAKAARAAKAAGSPPAQPSSSSGTLVCKLCCTRSVACKWGSTYSKGPGQPAVPHGSYCLACKTLHAEAFPFMDIDELAAKKDAEPTKTQIQQAKLTTSGEHITWLPDSVVNETSCVVSIQRPLIILNSTEYKTYFKRPVPGSRGPKLPTMTVPKEGDPMEVEKVFCFQDPSCPFRRAVVSTNLIDKVSTHRLEPDKNVFENNGKYIFNYGIHAQQEELGSAWLQRGIAPPSLEDHFMKVNPDALDSQRTGDVQLPLTAGAQGGPQQPFVVEDDSQGVVDDKALSMPLRRSVEQAGMLGPGIPASAMKKPRLSGQSSHAHQEPGPGGNSDAGYAQSLVEPGDSVSQVGSQLAQSPDEDAMKGQTSSQRLAISKAKLPLSAIMEGKKLGRSEINARKHLKDQKLDHGDNKLLRSYLKLAPGLVLSVGFLACLHSHVLMVCPGALLQYVGTHDGFMMIHVMVIRSLVYHDDCLIHAVALLFVVCLKLMNAWCTQLAS
jgi:hypothetical protein